MAPLFSEKEERVGDQPHSLRGENLSWILDIALLKTMEIDRNSSLHSIMHPLSVALNPSPQAPAEDAPVSLTLSHSFQFIQGEPTRGLTGIYTNVTSSFNNLF